jgi:hypothetical protein
MPAYQDTSERIHLRPGERRVLHLPAGAELWLASGRLQLTQPPRWIGESAQQLVRMLATGEGHVMHDGGAVTLKAGGAAVLVCRRPAPRAASVTSAASATSAAWAAWPRETPETRAAPAHTAATAAPAGSSRTAQNPPTLPHTVTPCCSSPTSRPPLPA